MLWALVLVSLLVLRLSAAGSGEARLGGNLRRAAAAEAAADGAFAESCVRLMDRNNGWSLAGGTHRLRLAGGGEAVVTVTNEAGKIDLNSASPVLLAGLVQAVGGSSDEGQLVAQAVVAWHTPLPPGQEGQVAAPYRRAGRPYTPPGAPFESVDELALVDGMTPALMRELAPHVTVFQNGDPVLALADPVVRRAAAAAAQTDTSTATGDLGSDDTVTLRVEARVAGAVFTRIGTVQLEPGASGAAYRVLAWTEGAR